MKNLKKRMALLLAGIMLLSGCGASDDTEASSGINMGTEAANANSMGRYLETEMELPAEVSTRNNYPQAYLQKLDSGELELVELIAGKYISGDDGETWEHVDTPWLSSLVNRAYISQIGLSPDGAMAIIYDPNDRTDMKAEGNSGEDSQMAVVETSFESVYQPEYLYVDSEGNTRDIIFQEKGSFLYQFWFGKDSALYAFDMNDNVYAVDTESGSMKKLFQTVGRSDYVCFTEKYMVVIASGGITIYDLEAGMVTEEDTVLQDFIAENLGTNIRVNTDRHAVVAVEGEQEDVIYFAFRGGLYRHVIGGMAVEQVVDGALSSFGDPMMLLQGMAILPDNEFVVLYNDAKLYRYVYDPDIPTVPEEQLSVYSLKEDDTIRQAVSLFQKQNPEVYIRYEVGISGENGMTSEDVIKNLNTKLMSGSGPDILVLDGLPADSYKEKGILTDLSSMEESMSGEESLFPNLVDACRENGGLYALPVRFRIPMLAGDRECVKNITDLESLADSMEALRAEIPKGSLLGVWSEEELLYTLGLTSSAAWVNEEGKIDEEKLMEFLTQAKRIYQAELAGLDEYEVKRHQEDEGEYRIADVTEENPYEAQAVDGAIDIGLGTRKFAVGKVDRLSFDYNTLATLEKQEENFGFGLWQGQIQNGFIPSTMVGICAGSADNERVRDFYRFLFGRELQDIDLPGGFPLNVASFETFSENPYEDDLNGFIAASDEEGNEFMIKVLWADAEEFQKLKDMVQSASQICTGDSVIEKAVYEIGVKALNGNSSVEDTVTEIVKKAGIYLAE